MTDTKKRTHPDKHMAVDASSFFTPDLIPEPFIKKGETSFTTHLSQQNLNYEKIYVLQI